MTMTPTTTEVDWRSRYYDAQQTIADLRSTVKALDESGKGNHSWLQSKNAFQRAALERLNRRVVAQRFQLRTLEKLGRGLSASEVAEARRSDPKASYVDFELLQDTK